MRVVQLLSTVTEAFYPCECQESPDCAWLRVSSMSRRFVSGDCVRMPVQPTLANGESPLENMRRKHDAHAPPEGSAGCLDFVSDWWAYSPGVCTQLGIGIGHQPRPWGDDHLRAGNYHRDVYLRI